MNNDSYNKEMSLTRASASFCDNKQSNFIELKGIVIALCS